MYECKNCGGDLRFDIASQQLACYHCGTLYDPAQMEKQWDAEERPDPQNYQVRIFTCPSCGAEIESTNLTAAGFCNYCGTATVLSSRVQQALKPQKIIPFKMTKEDCKEAYRKLMKASFYAPSFLRDPAFLDRFIGYYLPYWHYPADIQGKVTMPGLHSYSRGNYDYEDYYDLDAYVDASYRGLAYDASSSFEDPISEAIAPYPEQAMLPFKTGYLLGFYADTADVPGELYSGDAKKLIAENIGFHFRQMKAFGKCRVLDASSGSALSRLPIKMGAERAMYPVWFMTYRQGDRLSYSVVNGATGRIYADVPVDWRKYVLVSLLLSLILFFLLNLFLTLTAHSALLLTSVLAAFSVFLFMRETAAIERRETRADDRGYQWREAEDKKKEQQGAQSLAASAPTQAASNGGAKKPKKGKRKRKGGGQPASASTWIAILIFGSVCFIYFGLEMGFLEDILEGIFSSFSAVCSFVLLIITVILFFMLRGHAKKLQGGHFPEAWGALLAGLVSCGVFLWNPVGDIYYYIASALSFFSVGLALYGILRRYNELCLRPLPKAFSKNPQA